MLEGVGVQPQQGIQYLAKLFEAPPKGGRCLWGLRFEGGQGR
jgi:hypothetical protein